MLPDLIAGFIPSPSDGVWDLGPVPIRGYALCIIVGIVAAIWIGERRWVARGGQYGDVQDLAIWAVPFGLVGARAYHVATDWEKYFGDGASPITALYVWRGGLGIWGGVALGALGVYLGARRKGIRVLPMLDTLAPGVLVAQAIGRWGNWFNQELYGRPTDVPWALKIDEEHFSSAYERSEAYVEWETARQKALEAGQTPVDWATFHPTFLYECLWNLAAFAVVIWLERRFRLGHGRVLAVYVMAYTLGRGWIEYLRIDDVQLENVLGLRFNVWTSIVLFVAAAAYFVWSLRRHPGREDEIYRDGFGPDAPEVVSVTVGGDKAVEEAGEEADDTAAEDPGDTVDDDAGSRADRKLDAWGDDASEAGKPTSTAD